MQAILVTLLKLHYSHSHIIIIISTLCFYFILKLFSILFILFSVVRVALISFLFLLFLVYFILFHYSTFLLYFKVHTIVLRNETSDTLFSFQPYKVESYFLLCKAASLQQQQCGIALHVCFHLLCNTATVPKDSKWQGQLTPVGPPPLSFLSFLLDSATWKQRNCLPPSQCFKNQYSTLAK